MNLFVRGLVDRFASERVYQLVISLCVGVVATVGSFLMVGFSPAFVATPFSRFLGRYMPDVVIRYAITILGDFGQKLSLLAAVGLTVLLFAVVMFVSYKVQERFGRLHFSVPFSVGLVLVTSYGLTFSLESAVGATVPVMVLLLAVRVVLYFDTSVSSVEDSSGDVSIERVSDSRRGFIISSVGALLFSLFGVGKAMNSDSSVDISGENPVSGYLDQADQKSFDVNGLEALVSGSFYEVDINSINPDVDKGSWELSVTGEVESSVSVDYDELKDMESESRFETLRCVGERLNGKKMDTAFWTGVPVMPLLDEASVNSGCGCVMVRAEDGYYEEFPLEALEDSLLVYQMNGRPLPRKHGAPVRLLVPGHWGEINVKWVSEIEILDKEMDGYWEERGWHGTGPVNTIAKLHAVNMLEGGNREVAGHAYAGVRGIDRVEVSVDGGDTWSEAELTDKLEPSIDAWHQWRFDYDPPSESHTVVVRAVDGNGDIQPKKESGAFPSGPSGWVSREF